MHRAFRVYRTEHRIVLSISVSLFAQSWAPTFSFTSSSFDAISLYIRKRNTHSCSFARIERLRPESKSESVGQPKKRDAYSVTFCWLLPAFFRPMSLLKWFSTCSTLARNGYANKRQRGNRKNNRRSQELQLTNSHTQTESEEQAQGDAIPNSVDNTRKIASKVNNVAWLCSTQTDNHHTLSGTQRATIIISSSSNNNKKGRESSDQRTANITTKLNSDFSCCCMFGKLLNNQQFILCFGIVALLRSFFSFSFLLCVPLWLGADSSFKMCVDEYSRVYASPTSLTAWIWWANESMMQHTALNFTVPLFQRCHCNVRWVPIYY